MKILVIGPSWVGDMMMSQSLYRTLKSQHPDAKIDVMAPEWCRPLLAKMPEVNNTIPMPLGHGVIAIGERYRLGKLLREHGYDKAYVLPNSFKSALIPYFANIPKRIGWKGEMRFGLLNDIRPLNKEKFPLMVQRYVALAYDKKRIHSVTDIPHPILWPQISVSDKEIAETTSIFQIRDDRPIIGFCPGAEFGPAKRWPHYHYGSLAKSLIEQRGYQVLLFGSQKDYEAGEQIRHILEPHSRQHCSNFAGKTSLEQAVNLLAVCQAIITNDSGLMHIAAALNKPLVALYGPSSPDFTPPLSKHAKIIRLINGYQKIRKGDNKDGYHHSLVDITPQQVLTSLDDLFTENLK